MIKKKAIITVAVIVVLVLKYFISACPMLPKDYFIGHVFVSNLNFYHEEVGDLWTKLLIWLNCYISVPYPASLNKVLSPAYTGQAGLSFSDDKFDEILLLETEVNGFIAFTGEGQERSFITMPGLAGSLQYFIRDYRTALVNAG